MRDDKKGDEVGPKVQWTAEDRARHRAIREAESGTKRKAGRVRNWAAPPTSERSSTGRGILISAHPSRAPRGTIGRL